MTNEIDTLSEEGLAMYHEALRCGASHDDAMEAGLTEGYRHPVPNPVPNPSCYGCSKPISDELLALVLKELKREGYGPPVVEDGSVLCEACGGYTLAEAKAWSL